MTGTTVPDRPEEIGKKRPLWLLLVLACALFAGGLAVAFVVLDGSDDDDGKAELDPALVLQLQNLCFENDPPLFYDDQGYCYMVDPSTLSGDELTALRVLPGPVAPAEAEAMAEPVAPGESATPADGSTDTTTSTTPAPTTTSTAATPTSSTTSTSTTTSTTTPTAINIEASGWVWSLTVGQVDGAQCVSDGGGDFPPGCEDQLQGPYNVFFGVSNGGVSGTQMVAQLEKSVTFDGFISPSGAASLNIDMENLGRMSHGGTLTGNCLITGDYQYSDGRNISGTFSLTSTGPGC